MAKEGLILLNLLFANSPKKIWDILQIINDPDKIFTVDITTLEKIPSLNAEDLQKIKNPSSYKILNRELALLKKNDLAIIDFFEQDYPYLLKEIDTPPVLLYLKGDKKILNQQSLAIVGTRIPSLYGQDIAADFAFKLSARGLVIVSGLALGIDTIAHKSALKAAATIAVLGSGLLNIYPKDNLKLFQEIVAKGVVISEFPLLTAPVKYNFPQRNRIISGLALGVLVIEAANRSGSLITAHHACQQNREVFAIPGKIDSPLSFGNHKLIKEGAKLVDCLEDILEELNIQQADNQWFNNIALSEEENKLLDLITSQGIYLEELLQKLPTNTKNLLKIILNLQLKGLIYELSPGFYKKR